MPANTKTVTCPRCNKTQALKRDVMGFPSVCPLCGSSFERPEPPPVTPPPSAAIPVEYATPQLTPEPPKPTVANGIKLGAGIAIGMLLTRIAVLLVIVVVFFIGILVCVSVLDTP